MPPTATSLPPCLGKEGNNSAYIFKISSQNLDLVRAVKKTRDLLLDIVRWLAEREIPASQKSWRR